MKNDDNYRDQIILPCCANCSQCLHNETYFVCVCIKQGNKEAITPTGICDSYESCFSDEEIEMLED